MILKLSTLEPEQRQAAMAGLESAYASGAMLRPFDDFDENGLKYPIEHLNAMGASVILLPLEVMANYADVVCANWVKENEPELKEQILQSSYQSLDLLESAFADYNTTAIGNFAYVAVNHREQKVRDAALYVLEKLANWFAASPQYQKLVKAAVEFQMSTQSEADLLQKHLEK